MFRIIVDQGGTFADGVLVDEEQQITVAKAETNPDDPASSIMNCIIQLAKECNLTARDLLANTTSISIGTTLGTNAILEEKGARCCQLHTKGFRDTFQILVDNKGKSLDIHAFYRELNKFSYYNAFFRVKDELIDRGLINIRKNGGKKLISLTKKGTEVYNKLVEIDDIINKT